MAQEIKNSATVEEVIDWISEASELPIADEAKRLESDGRTASVHEAIVLAALNIASDPDKSYRETSVATGLYAKAKQLGTRSPEAIISTERFIDDAKRALVERYSTKGRELTPEDFSLITYATNDDLEKQAIVLTTNAGIEPCFSKLDFDPFTTSYKELTAEQLDQINDALVNPADGWSSIMDNENSRQHEVEVDGKLYDTRAGMSWDVYQVLAQSVSVDRRLLGSSVSLGGTYLTGEAKDPTMGNSDAFRSFREMAVAYKDIEDDDFYPVGLPYNELGDDGVSIDWDVKYRSDGEETFRPAIVLPDHLQPVLTGK